MLKPNQQTILFAATALAYQAVCKLQQRSENKAEQQDSTTAEKKKEPISQPLVSHIYTADPSAHVFNGTDLYLSFA